MRSLKKWVIQIDGCTTVYDMAALKAAASYGRPLARTAHMVCTSLLAIAATTTLYGRRANKPVTQSERLPVATFTVHLAPDFVGTVHLHISLPDPLDLRHQVIVTLGADAAQSRIALTSRIPSIA